MPSTLLTALRQSLAAAADPARAPGMQAYMKSTMPYHGVSSVPARRIFKAVFDGLAFPDAESWEAAVQGIWDGARFREERYAALALAGHKSGIPFQTPDALPLYERLIVDGAWWDFVDDLAVHRVGPLLRSHPVEIAPQMVAWSLSDDMWKRRSAIICQVGAKDAIDLGLLFTCIEPALSSREFFLRKAIGWALRQHAWRDPQAVLDYVAAHEARLSPLSRREALKNIARP